MTDLLAINGIQLDLTALAHDEVSYPDTVPGRVVQIDADFLAYQVSYEKPDDPKSADDMKHNASVSVEHLRRMAGAEHVHLHLTPLDSDKGGRYKQALLKKYQDNRSGKEKPRMLHVMRNHLATAFPATMWKDCEADDGMSMAQYKARAEGNDNLCVIASKDKDLNMVPGWHMDWDTGELIHTGDEFGWVNLKDNGKTKKLVGFGQKFFWAQMLIGDTADNISGIPAIPGAIMNRIKPTAVTMKAEKVLEADRKGDHVTEKALATARKAFYERKPGKCGPATAILLLDMMHDNKQAFNAVRGVYEMYGSEIGFQCYNGRDIPFGKAFMSEAQLLWMRRKNSPTDVLDWIGEIL